MSTPLTPEIVERHGRFVRELAGALLRDQHAADDLAQEAWTRWLVHPPRTSASPAGWLGRVVRHLASNRRRALARRAGHEALAAEPEPARAPDDEAAERELLHRLVDAVFALPEPYRETILARYFRGLSARELAAQSETPLATVRSREQRGLELLRAGQDREHGGRGAWALILAPVAAPEALVAGKSWALAWVAALVMCAAGVWWLRSRAGETEARPNPSVSLAAAKEPRVALDPPVAIRDGRRALEAAATASVVGRTDEPDEHPAGRLGVTLRDVAGAGLSAKASVRLRGEECADAQPPLLRPLETWTDVEGRAWFGDVPCGAHLVVELDLGDEFSEQIDRHVGRDLVLDGSPGVPIVVGAGETLELLATWDVAQVVRGRVVDAQGRPLAESQIELRDRWTYCRTESDSQGTFELHWRPLPEHRLPSVCAQSPQKRHALGGHAATGVSEAKLERELAPEELDGRVPLVLTLGAAEERLVLSGIAVDSRGEPVEWTGHPERIRRSVLPLFESLEPFSTASGGAFLFAGLEPGLYDLAVTNGNALQDAAEPVCTVFRGLAAGREDLRLHLPASGAVHLRVRGDALAALGVARLFPGDPSRFPRPPAPPAQVLTERAFWPGSCFGASTYPDPEGVWLTTRLEGSGRELALALEPGWYRIGVASAPPLAAVTSELLWFAAGEYALEAQPPPATGILRGHLLADGARDFYGLVLADEHGRPFAYQGPAVGPSRVHVQAVKASGEFVLGNLPVGRYRLRAGRESELEQGRFTREVELEVVAGENPPLEIEL